MGRRALWGLWVVSLIAVIAYPLFWNRPFSPPSASMHSSQKVAPFLLPVYGHLTSFLLIDQEGRSFGNQDLRGRIWIASFIFTSCAGQCPQITAQMAGLQAQLPEKIHLVSLSVDPHRDTPAILMHYGKAVGADFHRWHFLTGDLAQVTTLVQREFHLPFDSSNAPEEPILHSARLVLVDGNENIRGFYDATDPRMVRQLILDAQRLLERSIP